MQIQVIDLDGQSFMLTINPHDTIKQLRETLQRVRKIEMEGITLSCGPKVLEDGKISDYDIQACSTICMDLAVSGGQVLGSEFVDITGKSKAVEREWSKTAAKYRRARPGLCLEGKCTTKECVAYNKKVIINKGMGKYNLIEDEYQNTCPMCNNYVQTTTCAFNRCWYTYSGKIIEFGRPPKKVEGKEEKVENCYRKFDPEKVEMVRWAFLEITTRKL